MVSLALVDNQAFPSPLGRSTRREEPICGSAGEIQRMLRRLSGVRLRAALYRLRFAALLEQGRLAEIEGSLARFGAVERLTDGSFAVLDISPAAMTATAEASTELCACLARLCAGGDLRDLEIATLGFWTDEVTAEELSVPRLQ